VRTADVIAKALTDWGIPVHRGLGKTGVVGIVKNGTSSRAVGLRADIDALPMTEHNQLRARQPAPRQDARLRPRRPHRDAAGRGQAPGPAPQLRRHRLPRLPAGRGRRRRRARDDRDGLFEKFPMEAIFGAHNWPGMPVGMVGVNPGAMMASSNEFRATIRGKGSHAALPHLGVDPVPVACQMVMAWQTIITRNRKPIDPGVISATMIHAGEATNVVPDSAEIRGTVRTFSIETLDLIERACARSPSTPAPPSAPPASSSSSATTRPPSTTRPRPSSCACWRGGGRRQRGALRADDGRRGLQLLPAGQARLLLRHRQRRRHHREGGHGLGPCMLHNPSYDFNDELIPLGATAWVRIAEQWLATPR
jgi:metal-dependent amidase/aminoacylase/carboxypeptidase family protein